jgi:hypothetical protein
MGVEYSNATYTLTDWNHFCLMLDDTWNGDIYWNHAGNQYAIILHITLKVT